MSKMLWMIRETDKYVKEYEGENIVLLVNSKELKKLLEMRYGPLVKVEYVKNSEKGDKVMKKASLPKNRYWPGSTEDLVYQECEPRFLKFFDRFLQEHIDGCKERGQGYSDLVAIQINFRSRFLQNGGRNNVR